VAPGSRAAVVGDGAVALCAVIAAKRLGAEQIIILGRHADGLALARDFGANRRRLRARRGGDRAPARCRRSSATSPPAAGRRPRAYLDELLPDVLDGRIDPGRVFDRTVRLDGVPDGYRAMAEREAIKVMVTP